MYLFALLLSLLVSAVLLIGQYRSDLLEPKGGGRAVKQLRALRWQYVVGFTLMSLGDWLQGPFLLDMYRSFDLNDSDVALLYMVDYGVGMLCCILVGSMSAIVGPKAACILYGVLYGVSCLCNNFPAYHGLVVLGCGLDGLCNALLRTSFESWLDSSTRRIKGLKAEVYEAWTGHMLAFGVWGSACGSIVAGLLCQLIVWTTTGSSMIGALGDYMPGWMGDWVQSPSFPFVSTMNVASLLLLSSAAGIAMFWADPSIGDWRAQTTKDVAGDALRSLVGGVRCFFPSRWSPELQSLRRVALVEVCVEGALLLFIGGLPSTIHAVDPTTPYGVTFVVLMASILVGSVAANWVISSGGSTMGLSGACYGAASAATFLGIVVAYESPATWARGGVLVAACVIEMCFGFYYPALAALHSQYTSIEGLRVMCVSLVRCLSYIYALVGLCMVWYTGSLAVYWIAIAAALFAAAALCK